MDPSIEVVASRIRGALLGGMIGDALGRPFEMMAGSDARLAGGLEATLLGVETLHTSDDTEMTIGVAESLLRKGSIERDDLLATLAANYDASRGYGHGMARALASARTGAHSVAFMTWPEGSKGNGGAVRVTPIAAAFHDDLALVAALAEDAAGVTHGNLAARGAAVAQAISIAHFIGRGNETEDEEIEANALVTKLLEFDVVRKSSVAPKLRAVVDLVAANASTEVAVRAFGNGVLADETVPLALFSFLRFGPRLTDVLKQTILAGGDTDSAAAMSGTLAGACGGESELPTEWLERIEKGSRGAERVSELAEGIFELWKRRRESPGIALRG